MFVVNKWCTILHHYANQGPKSVLSGARRHFFMRASEKKKSLVLLRGFPYKSPFHYSFITEGEYAATLMTSIAP